LDGGKVIAPFLPIHWNMWLEQHQGQLSMVLLILILFVGSILAVPVTYIGHNLLDLAQIMANKIA
jgi:hypothetical protein